MKSIPDLCKYYKISRNELFLAMDKTLRYFRMNEELEEFILAEKSKKIKVALHIKSSQAQRLVIFEREVDKIVYLLAN